MTFTPKFGVLAQEMGSGERACVRFFKKICLRVGVSEIEKTKKRQSHRISAKKLILNAPPMNDVHTKNQGPSSKNGLVRAYPRPFFQKIRLSVGVSEIEKMKKRQSHQISANIRPITEPNVQTASELCSASAEPSECRLV